MTDHGAGSARASTLRLRADRRPRQVALPALLALLALLAGDRRSRRRLHQCSQGLQVLRAELAVLRQQSAALAANLLAQARTNPLTGLGNRRRWDEQLAHELDRAQRTGTPLAVAVLDVDEFKAVNDAVGHAAGDALLRQLAAGFLPAVRSVDLVARMGGDKFAVALPDVSPDAGAQIIKRLRSSALPAVSCSAGLAVWDRQESADALYARADAAMYWATNAGRSHPGSSYKPPAPVLRLTANTDRSARTRFLVKIPGFAGQSCCARSRHGNEDDHAHDRRP